MPIITSAPPTTHGNPVALVRGFLTSCVSGASLAAFAVGCVIESVQLIVGSLVLPVVYVLLNHLAGAPKRARTAAVLPVRALAMIESLHATGSELSANVPIDFDLTVAPDDAPAFRVVMSDHVNLVDVPDYRPRDILVVEYPPDRPWQVKLVKEPPPEWKRRAADAVLDSAHESTLVREPPKGRAYGAAVVVGLLVGVAVVLLSFRTDLTARFDGSESDAGRPSVTSSSSTSTSSSSTTTVVSSGSGTVVLGSGKSFLDRGELRKAVESLTGGGDKGRALTVALQDSTLSVVFPPKGPQIPLFDPNSLPYERIPALVNEARTTLGVRSPESWQLTADRLTGSLNIRVSVTGAGGDTASLVADGKGEVIRRSPAQG
ncbi:hypothetical protein GCM10023084_69280 [Streptomyces lacrimifluminis]|uniref:Uncharacterized protein n=1 Tax=Streptomyces lacrimifluminis TaxID=1500077 RepID=A0A917P3X7_9ACTN|nr:hypothetical protein [Streptomyces lacrimifluminis]GGJ60434.1 hypothetical protein GCM10012282_67100 [Streptomyces lacrimifluminis]